MKQLIIILLIIIAMIIGYGKYSQYKRYSSPEVNYKKSEKIDLNYYNKEVVFNYFKAVEDLDSYTMLQWSANNIDVRTPEDDDIETRVAIKNYADKLAKVKYYETILENAASLKEKGVTNKEIQYLEESGVDLETHQQKKEFEKIKKLFSPNINLYNGEKNAIIFEVQKRLNALGDSLKIDGVYRIETLNAIKKFEEKNNLLADGFIDALTLEYLF